MNTRERVLKEALNCVNGEREKQYGNPEDNFSRIADFWGLYLTTLFEGTGVVVELEPKDVAIMMILFKIARSLGDQDKLDNYVDMIGYASCAAEILERNEEDSKKVKEWVNKVESMPNVQIAEECKECAGTGVCLKEKEDRNNIPQKRIEVFPCDHIKVVEECRVCNYREKCMGTGVCLKETEEKCVENGEKILDNFADLVNERVRKKTEEKKWFDGCSAKKDKPDDKCNREDCGQFDACMTAYQHYMYNKTKEASEAIDKCMCEQINKNDVKSNSFWDTYKSIFAHITSFSKKEGVDQSDVVSRLTKNGHGPTEIASLVLVGRLNVDTVSHYIEDAIHEVKNGYK